MAAPSRTPGSLSRILFDLHQAERSLRLFDCRYAGLVVLPDIAVRPFEQLRVLVELVPARLGGRFPTSDHVLGHRGFGHLDAQLYQFAVNSRSAPGRILTAHCSNQIASILWHKRPAWFAVTNLPSPIPTKSLTLPADDGFRLDDD
jgi:hypothetical protein